MKRKVLGTLVCVGLGLAAVGMVGQHGEAFAQRTTAAIPAAPAMSAPGAVAGSELIVVPTSVGDKSQVLTVIDPRQKVLSVYHIDLMTGKITLRSVRNISWDLQIRDMNTEKPLPQEIQSLLEQK